MQKSERHLPEIAYCAERVRLADRFLEAIHNLTTFQTEQTRAVIDGDICFSRFDLLIHMAVEAKEEAKYALIEHIQDHGCEQE